MGDININQIKYLDYDGLRVLWEKISNTFLRDSEVVKALTDTTGGIIEKEEDLFVQSKTLNELIERIEDIESAQGTNIDNDTIINEGGVLKTNLILQNDADAHVLKLITGNGKGTTVSEWNYDEFYKEAVKDGIFEDVSLVVIPGDETELDSGQAAGTYLKFIFNTSTGSKPIYVNVTELIDVYTGSDYISVTKSGETSSIELNKAKLVEDLKKADALDITSITTKIEGLEGKYTELEGLIEELKAAWDELDVAGLKEQIETNTSNIADIQEYLATVPSIPISPTDIENLDKIEESGSEEI